MAEAELEQMPAVVARRRNTARIVALVLLGVVTLALLALWLARKPIATNVIDRELARRGVPARYAVKRIGLRTQRIEGVSIGDPRAPDLTADWVEVDLVPTFGTPEVREVRAGGVRVRGRLENGALKLGAVDRLLPGPTGKTFSLPKLRVGLSDAQLALATPSGNLALRIDGRGSLASGFDGRYALAAPALSAGGCRIAGLDLSGTVRTSGGRPRLAGPLAAFGVTCKDALARAVAGTVDVTFEPGMDGWRGLASLATGGARVQAWQAAGLRGQIDFAG
ncbi:MAG TPA: hypothetical protein VE567_03410, partial [Sphingomonas sp.]|nr:hypothetical protein [Sphingomonas sp.]